LVEALADLKENEFVLDGEIVIYAGEQLSFDGLLLRIHPAESRIRKLSVETPATLMCFDLLVDADGKLLTGQPLSQRRSQLEGLFRRVGENPLVRLRRFPRVGKKRRNGCSN
jgi:ATP-dependent DNA ligase